eukprot:COSAG06_NODE_28777_length_568_cov_1.230277_1_plen_74_part_01
MASAAFILALAIMFRMGMHITRIQQITTMMHRANRIAKPVESTSIVEWALGRRVWRALSQAPGAALPSGDRRQH